MEKRKKETGSTGGRHSCVAYCESTGQKERKREEERRKSNGRGFYSLHPLRLGACLSAPPAYFHSKKNTLFSPLKGKERTKFFKPDGRSPCHVNKSEWV